MLRKLSLTFRALLLFLGVVLLQGNNSGNKDLDFSPRDVVSWTPISSTSYEDGTIVARVYLETRENFGLYDTKLKIFDNSQAMFASWIPPLTASMTDPMTGKKAVVFQNGEFVFIYHSLFPFQSNTFNVELQYTGCSNKICLFPFKETLVLANHYSPDPHPEEIKALIASGTHPPKPPLTESPEAPSVTHKPEQEDSASLFSFSEESFDKKVKETTSFWSLFWFLFFLFLAGIATNLTPCVYPMIPITIKILSRQKTSPMLASSLYALGIMLTYSTLAFIAILSGSMFGNFLANVYVNLFLCLVMFYFGLSMLGYGDYSFLQKLGNKFSTKGKGLKTAFVMGLGAGLLASPCTGPILGSLLTYSATSSQSPNSVILYFLTYSLGFSLPYVFLGKAASQLTKIQFRSSLQTFTKTVFAGVMFALFFYYLRIPFYRGYKGLTDLWPTILGASLVLSLSFLLFKKTRELRALRIIGTLLLGLSFFSFTRISFTESPSGQIPWLHNENKALQLAEETKKPVFIDMWAEWCEVCKKIEQTTFSHPEVIKRLSSGAWIPLKLDLTEESKENEEIYKKYELVGLPTLVILPEGLVKDKEVIQGEITVPELLKRLDLHSKG